MSSSAEIYDEVMKSTFATGSEAYGLESADIDRWAGLGVVQNIVGMLKAAGVPYMLATGNSDVDGSGGCSGSFRIRFRLSMVSKDIDLFAVGEHEFNAFHAITEMVTTAARFFPTAAATKALRVHLFQILRSEFQLWRCSTETDTGKAV